MRKNGDIYEYIAIYIDDNCIASKDPKEIARQLEDKYKFKLKGTGHISYHLRCAFFHDSTGALCFSPKIYIEKMKESCIPMFGTASKEVSFPLGNNDHPAFDASVSILNMLPTMGRVFAHIDIMTNPMTMSGKTTS